MTPASSSRPLVVRLPSKHAFTINGREASQLFQLLRLGDPSMSLAWHSIWHGLEKTP